MYQSTSQFSGLGCVECGANCKGMGDFTSLGIQDWAMLAGVAVVLMLAGNPKHRTRAKKSVTGFGGGFVSAAIIGVGGYLAYQYLQQNPSALSLSGGS